MNLATNVRTKITFPTNIHPELLLRHLTTPTSPPPDHASVNVPPTFREPAALAQTSITPDFTNNGYRQRMQLGTRTEVTPRSGRGGRFRAYVGSPDFHILPPLRKRTSYKQRMQIRELPQIYICPAPKYIRQQQRTSQQNLGYDGRRFYHRHPPLQTRQSEVTKPPQEASPVTIPLPLPAASPVEGIAGPIGEVARNLLEGQVKNKELPKAMDIVSLPLKPVNLNKGLEAASAQFGNETNLTIALSRKHVPKRLKNSEPRDVQVMSLSHLPLREVYLKPESGSTREMAAKQQREKMLRIIDWLKELNYLDEKTIERGRIEIEKTQFQLPEIKDSTMIA